MASFSQIASTLHAKAAAELATALAGWPLQRPNGPELKAPASQGRASLAVDFGQATVDGFGCGAVVGRQGRLSVYISAPAETGPGDALERAQAVAETLNEGETDSVRLGRASLSAAELDGPFWTVRVAVPWRFRKRLQVPPAARPVTPEEGWYGGELEARNRIAEAVRDAIALPVVFSNGPEDLDDIGEPTAFVDILYGETFTETLGDDAPAELVGIIQARIFTPLGRGDGPAMELADVFEDVLALQQLGELEIGVPTILGQGVEGGWWGTTIVAPINVTKSTEGENEAGSGDPPPPIDAPEPQFSASPLSGTAPLEVQFADESLGQVDSWFWVFGDGSSSTAQNPVHTYLEGGTYTVSLRVTGPGGSGLATVEQMISVDEPAVAPIAEFTAAPLAGVSPLAVGFTSAAVGGIDTHAWDFGDGVTSTAINPTHTYAAAGTYTVSLTVTGPGGSDTETKANLVTVSEPAPVADFSYSPSGGETPLEVAFSDLSSGSITSRTWSFGDGSMSTEASPTHTYATAGTYTVQLTVTGPGGEDTATVVDAITVSEPVEPETVWAEVDSAERSVDSYSEGDIIRGIISLPKGDPRFPASARGGASNRMAWSLDGVTPLVSQWSGGTRYPGSFAWQTVELLAIVPAGADLSSTSKLKLLNAVSGWDAAPPQPGAWEPPSWYDAQDRPKVTLDVLAHFASASPGGSVELDLLADANRDDSTFVDGPLFVEVEGGQPDPLLGCARGQFRIWKDREAFDFVSELSTGNVDTPQPDRRFQNLRLTAPAGFTPRSRTDHVDDSTAGNVWTWSSQVGVLFQFSGHPLDFTMVADTETFDADGFTDRDGFAVLQGGYGFFGENSALTASRLPVPNYQANSTWQAVAADFLAAWNSDIAAFDSGSGGDHPWTTLGPYRVQFPNDAGFGSTVGIMWPGPTWMLSTATPFAELLRSCSNWLQGCALRRRGQLFNADGTHFNPDDYSTGPDRFMPSNCKLLRDVSEGPFGNRHHWLFLNVGDQDFQGWDQTPELDSSDTEAPPYEATWVRYGPADHQHITRAASMAWFLAVATNDWLARRMVVAHAVTDALCWYDGTGGQYNAAVTWEKNLAEANPGQGAYFYRDLAWILANEAEAHRLCEDPTLRTVFRRHAENVCAIANACKMPNGGLLIERSGINVQAINFPVFGSDTTNWHGGTKTWSNAMSQFALLAACESVFTDEDEIKVTTLATARDVLQSQAMGWSLSSNRPSFSHLVGPSVSGVYDGRVARQAGDPQPPNPHYESQGYYSSPGDQNPDDDSYWLSGVAAAFRVHSSNEGDGLTLLRIGALLHLWTNSTPSSFLSRLADRVFDSNAGPMSGFSEPMVGVVQQLGANDVQNLIASAPSALLQLDGGDNPLKELLIEAGFSA